SFFPIYRSNSCFRGRREEGRPTDSSSAGRPIDSLFRGLVGGPELTRLEELDVQAERLKLLDENVERLGETRLERVFALDDGFVHARAAHDVVRLDGEELLERVR